MSAARDSGAAVVAVDFRTLSGRAVVVRVSDGVELGSAAHEDPHGVVGAALPVTGERLPHDRGLQVPSDDVDVHKTVVPQALGVSRVVPACPGLTCPPSSRKERPW